MSTNVPTTLNSGYKVINLALGAPGCGKTQALINYIPQMLANHELIFIAVPTLSLNSSISLRCDEGNIPHRVINSSNNDKAAEQLKECLTTRSSQVVISTHASMLNIPSECLKGWSVVIDELPLALDLPDFTYETSELTDLFQLLQEDDGKLTITKGNEAEVTRRVKTQRREASGTDQNSAISSSLAKIYQALLSGHPVFIDSAMQDGKRHVRPVIETKLWERFESARNVHLLAAHIEGGLFDVLAKAKGFSYGTSPIQPEKLVYSGDITIYPLVANGRHFSKSLALKPTEIQLVSHKHAIQDTYIIDLMLETAINNANGVPLLFSNKWAPFHWLAPHKVLKCSYDSRGLNEYSKHSDAILLFGGNPSPADTQSLKFLSEKYGVDFEAPFVTTRLLEPSLQSAARTAVRTKGNTASIQLFVQDERVAQFLTNTYMTDAKISKELASQIPQPVDGRKEVHLQKDEGLRLIGLGLKNSEISGMLGIHRNTVSKWRKEFNEMTLTSVLTD